MGAENRTQRHVWDRRNGGERCEVMAEQIDADVKGAAAGGQHEIGGGRFACVPRTRRRATVSGQVHAGYRSRRPVLGRTDRRALTKPHPVPSSLGLRQAELARIRREACGS
jgi:hypothetical protein